MSRYRRNYDPNWRKNAGPTKTIVHWSAKNGAYYIKWMDTNHWDEMQVMINYIKGFPYGEREYNPDDKSWLLIEKHINGLKTMIEMIPSHFTLDWQEKPLEQATTTKFIPMDVHLDNFKTITGFDIRGKEHKDAKRIYFRACMQLHPDHNSGDAIQMTELNVAWTAIEKEHYKKGVQQEYAIQ